MNDTQGHLAGDEEFVIVLTNAPIESAVVISERVCKKVAKLSFPEIDAQFQVTVSIGLAEHDKRATAVATLKRVADALYQTQRGGRYRRVCAP